MIEKMQFVDKELKDEDALCWALAAKNSLENYQGFSPAQLTFGENTMLPALHSAGPPGMEEIQVSFNFFKYIYYTVHSDFDREVHPEDFFENIIF